MDKTAILKLAQEENVQMIQLQFTDILGVMKNISVPADQLENALDGELMFDGSSIEGFVRIEESDMYLKPDPETFLVLPGNAWYSHGNTARLICDIHDSNEDPFEGCPRQVLKKVLQEAKDLGYSMQVGPEPEFFMFNVDGKWSPTLTTHDKAGYFDLPPVDHGEEARMEMVKPSKSWDSRLKLPIMNVHPVNMRLISNTAML